MSSSSSPSPATNATARSDSSYMCSTPMSSAAAPAVCSTAKSVLNLPPGYHFVPTDAELVVHYLRPRLANASQRLPLPIFVNERILDYHPDTLIEKYRPYGEGRWFFFTERERKHLGGTRPNRTTPDNGHWNATGSVRAIRSAGGVLVGCRRTLVFYEASRSRKKKNQLAGGLPPTAEEEEEGDEGQAAKAAKDDGVKTEWTMYEYQSLTSEAEFEALRTGNANKVDELVLCTIQKKKHGQEGGERKKSSKRKTKEEGLELEDVPAGGGDVEQSSHAGTTEVIQYEDDAQRALMEAAAETQVERAYNAPAAGVGNFNNVDTNQSMPYSYLTNSLSPVPTPSQETLMTLVSGDNPIVMHQKNYCFNQSMMNMKNSQSFQVQETPPKEFLQCLDTKMAVPRGRGNTMDHMLHNWFVNMRPSQAHPVPGIGTYQSPSKSNVLERSAELHGDKPNRPLKPEDDDWWSLHPQTNLCGRELDNPYVPNSLSFVPAPQQETTMMELAAARGSNHTAIHHRNYLNHSSNMWNPHFPVQATLPQEEFPPYSGTKTAAPLGVGSIVDHHMLQNRIVNAMPAADAHAFSGFFPGLSSSNYGHLSTRMDHPAGPSSIPFPLQLSHGAGRRTGVQGPLLDNQVNLHHQNSAAAAAASSMGGYDQRNGVGLAPIV